MKKLILTALTIVGVSTLSSCVNGPKHEAPIRPVSPNSNIAHGSSSGNNGGALGGIDAFSR